MIQRDDSVSIYLCQQKYIVKSQTFSVSWIYSFWIHYSIAFLSLKKVDHVIFKQFKILMKEVINNEFWN